MIGKRRIWRATVLVCGVAIVAFLGVAWLVAGALIESNNRPIGPPPEQWNVEELKIPSDSGTDLATWYIPNEKAKASLALLHPLGADRRAMLGRAQLFHDAGYAVLLVDLQAHGESPGDSITVGYRERLDAEAAVDYLRARNPDSPIGVVGWSLGGAAALLASPLEIDALVLEAVYPTIHEAVNNRIAMRMGVLSHLLTPVLLVQMKPRLGISPADLSPIDRISEIDCPVLVIAGDYDSHTTLAETKRLYGRAEEPKQLLIFEGGTHTDLLNYDPENYRKVVVFLDHHLAPNTVARAVEQE